MSILDDVAAVDAHQNWTLTRAVNVVMGSAGLHDPAEGEEILRGLAQRLDRPVAAVAVDLVVGRDFPGRPAWL